MTPQQQEAFEQAYMPKAEAGEQKRFPALKPADFVLKEKREEADEAYQTAGYAFLLYMAAAGAEQRRERRHGYHRRRAGAVRAFSAL